MDTQELIAMAFVLILTLMVGGIILVYPIVKRLGSVMEEWLHERKQIRAEGPAMLALGEEIRETRELLLSQQSQLHQIVEHQRFLDSLAEESSGDRLASGESEASEPAGPEGDSAS